MKKGQIENGEYPFSYRENLSTGKVFNNRNFLVVVKDEEYPDRNVVPVVYCEGNLVRDVDQNDMQKIFIPINQIREQTMSLEYYKNMFQVLRISYGNIVSNDRYMDIPNYPKCRTYASNIHPMQKNEFAEIVEGDLNTEALELKLKYPKIESLLVELYSQEETPIFVLKENVMVGPFRVLNSEDYGKINLGKIDWKPFGEYEITEESFVEFNHFSIKRRIFISQINKLELIKTVDLKDDKEIIGDFIAKIGEGSSVYNRQKQRELQDVLNEVSGLKSVEKYIRENNRLKEILSNTEKVLISNEDLAKFIPEMELSIKRIKEKEKEKEKIEEKIEEEKQYLKEIESKIENAKNTFEKIKQEGDDILNEKKKEVQNIYKKVDSLKQMEVTLRGYVEELKKEGKNIQKNTLKSLIEISKNNIYNELINPAGQILFEDEKEKQYKNYSIEDEFENYISFRNELMEILKKNGREFTCDFIDNLLISIHQNTLTILGGLPGVGKTSLAKLITKILAPNDRVKEVSVGRGWTSQKDLIGFQNPLNNRFYSAPTGVYELLCQLDYESKNDSFLNSPMSFIVMDEANLSPIEHYWSCFYNLTDSVAKNGDLLSIQIGNNKSLNYANNLRFIATINYDQTTESLSPRVIDRANIIQIPNNTFDIDNVYVAEVKSLRVSYKKCIEFFKLFDFCENGQILSLGEEIESIFQQVKEKFNQMRIPISPRVEIGIRRYCNVSSALMEEKKGLDYCIAQRLLPMINLQGTESKKKLEELLLIVEKNSLEVCSKLLKNILNIGKDDGVFEGNYNYFLTLSYA